MKFSYKNSAVAVIVFTLILATILVLIVKRSENTDEGRYILKEYNNTVALYKGKEIQSIYEGIVVSSLPSSDRQRLIKGIVLENPEDAEAIIEDYDG